ncbi:MAG: hypothetical protein R2778_08050 [Saprospiraceae bacterium]
MVGCQLPNCCICNSTDIHEWHWYPDLETVYTLSGTDAYTNESYGEGVRVFLGPGGMLKSSLSTSSSLEAS